MKLNIISYHSLREILLFGIMFMVALAMMGCSESGGSKAIEPMSDEPMIVDSVMCIAVNNDRPDGITDVFFSKDDDRIYIWVYWSNLEDTSTAKVVWYKPDEDTPFREDSQKIITKTGFGITWFYIDKPSGGFEPGEWSVEIYLDGGFERSHLFTVE